MMTNRRMSLAHWSELLIMALVVVPASLFALDEKDAAQQERVKEALQLSLDSARSYELQLDEKSPKPLEFRPQAVLRWSNPEQGEIYGNVFVWTDRGRPEVVGSLFKWYTPHTHSSHEFQSLSRSPLTMSRDGTSVWHSEKPGLELKPVPNAPIPADSPALRLTQMRQLARKFTARSTDREGQELELRLLTQPVYRYEKPTADSKSTSTDWHDGALFVFVQGTDPEVFLTLESRDHQGTPTWFFGLARMNSIAFQVNCDNKEVWHTETLPWRDVGSHKEPYTSFRYE